MLDNESTNDILKQRALEKLRIKKKIQRLFLVSLSIIIVSVIGFWYWNFGKKIGSTSLVDGIKNLGTTYKDNNKVEEKPYNKPLVLTIPTTAGETPENSNSSLKNYVSLDGSETNYDVKAKANNRILFINDDKSIRGLVFSDGQNLSLAPTEEKYIVFLKPGVYTYEDSIDDSSLQIKGTITIIE